MPYVAAERTFSMMPGRATLQGAVLAERLAQRSPQGQSRTGKPAAILVSGKNLPLGGGATPSGLPMSFR
jgi:hypothetical protein